MKPTIRRAIRGGIALLDKEYGATEWRSKIDIDTLDIAHEKHCILGQLNEHDFWRGKGRLGLTWPEAEALGFTCTDCWTSDELTDAWTEFLSKVKP
jgi:hypothetical protein